MNTRKLVAGLFMVTALLGEGAMAASCPRKGVSVTVLARGPAGLRIEGKGCELSVEEDAAALTFKVPLAPIETGIGLRDRHMRELLEAEKFPVATLRVARSGLTFPRGSEAAEGTADGELTLHGQSRPVKVRYRAEMGEGGVTQVRGSFQLDLRDFDLQAPSYLGVSVSPGVEIIAELPVHGP